MAPDDQDRGNPFKLIVVVWWPMVAKARGREEELCISFYLARVPSQEASD
jgi:hypothetical protein